MRAKRVSVAFEDQGKCGEISNAIIPFPICVTNSTLQNTNAYETEECISENRDDGGELILVGDDQAGAFTGSSSYQNLGLFFTMLLGKPTTVDNGDGTYSHSWVSGTECIPCVSVQHLWTNADECPTTEKEFFEQFLGVRAGTYAHSVSGKGINKYNVGLQALKYQDSIKDDPLTKFDVANEVVMEKTLINTNKATVTINSIVQKLNKFDINIDMLINKEFQLGTEDNLYSKGINVSGNIGGLFDEVLYGLFTDNQSADDPNNNAPATTSMEIKYEDTDKNYELKYVFDEMKFEFLSPPIEFGNKLMIDANYTAYRSPTGTQKLKIELKNNVAQYMA